MIQKNVFAGTEKQHIMQKLGHIIHNDVVDDDVLDYERVWCPYCSLFLAKFGPIESLRF